jgi:hypothetical protein
MNTDHVADIVKHIAKQVGVQPYLKAILFKLNNQEQKDFYNRVHLLSTAELKLRLKLLSTARVITVGPSARGSTVQTSPVKNISAQLVTTDAYDAKECSVEEGFKVLEDHIKGASGSLEGKRQALQDLEALQERYNYYNYGCIVFHSGQPIDQLRVTYLYLLERPTAWNKE